MIFWRKKKPKKYEECLKLYGKPGLTEYGEHVWGTLRFVRDAETGEIMLKTNQVRYLGKAPSGRCFYLGPKSRLKLSTILKPSFYE